VEGVQVVRDGDLVAVLHKLPDEADRALGMIKAQHDTPAAEVDDKTIYEHLLNSAPEADVVEDKGDIRSGEENSTEVFEEEYLNSYVAHAPIEPHTAVASIEGDKATVWASTQTPFGLHRSAARILGIPSENVRIITPYVGGGFGGKTRNQQAEEAVTLSKLTGRPVQVAWTREEEFMYDTFRPASVVSIRSGLSDGGKINFWDFNVYFAGSREAVHFYDVTNSRTAVYGDWGGSSGGAHPFGTGAWRAPAVNTNTFARESQIDIMAAKAGVDPLEFRLKNLKDQRMIRVLTAAADKFGWSPGKAPSGRGFGIACAIYLGAYVATVAEIGFDKDNGNIQAKRIVCALDLGLIINPEGVRIQTEGCVTMGLGYALTEEIHFRGGEVLDRNFGTYKLPRFSWVPEIETVMIENNETPAQGCGEPPIVCMGAVIANALYDASGIRMYQLPMTPERILNQAKGQ